MMKKSIAVILGLAALGAIGLYAWKESKEVRLCLDLSSRFEKLGRVPNSIKELPESIEELRWNLPGGSEIQGRRQAPEGTRAYQLSCTPEKQECSLLWTQDGRDTSRSRCIHPGPHTLSDYF